jgi:chaperonin GroEL
MFEQRDVHLGSDARKQMFKGVEKLANAVGSTLGPYGNNVVVELFNGQFITKDGVTVAKNVLLKDSLENMGAQIVKQSASKTNAAAGDGTTTSTVLAYNLVQEGMKILEDPTVSAVEVKKGMEKAFEIVAKVIDEVKIPVKGNFDRIKQVATISTNNDEELGSLIAKAFESAGEDGLVTVEESKSVNTSVEHTEGMQFDSGYLSPYFVTDNMKMNCEYKNPNILIINGKITNFKNLIPAFELSNKQGKPLLLIAHEVDASTIGLMVLNKMRNGFPVVAIKGPSFGNRREEMMKDIAILTGAKVYTDLDANTLKEITNDDFGSCEKIIVDKNSTSIINGSGNKEALEIRIKELKAELERQTLDWSKEQIQQRIAKMTSGVSIIKVGAVTESEMQEKKYRLEDAIHAVKAAIKDGIVPGSYKTYAFAMDKVAELMPAFEDSSSQDLGVSLVYRCLLSAFDKMLENAGLSEEKMSEIYKKLLENKENLNIGYNLKTHSFEDLLESGIIDPAIVAKEALRNAVSSAGMLLTTNCALTMVDKDSELEGHGIDPSMITV